MSGGVAYVYDPEDTFASEVNYEMVELEELDKSDRSFLFDTIDRHRGFTGSTVADRILQFWDTEIALFRKVMPVDYKRVLNVIEKSKQDALSEAERCSFRSRDRRENHGSSPNMTRTAESHGIPQRCRADERGHR